MRKPHRNGASREAVERMTVAELIARYPSTLEVFDRHGVHFCAGCYLTLTEDLKKVAGFHAVPDLERLVEDLKKAAKRTRR